MGNSVRTAAVRADDHAPSTLGAFAKSDPALASPDLEWHVQPLSLPKFGEQLHPYAAIHPVGVQSAPTSRGTCGSPTRIR
jgi:choline dehydrogenase-like flavoprotein